jgi:sporulation protein YlmC with PRC-barrel domain
MKIVSAIPVELLGQHTFMFMETPWRRTMLKRTVLAAALLICVNNGASAQSPVLPTIPAGVMTVTDWYKQNVYDPTDKKIGSINDVLVTKEGKVEVLIIGVGGFVEVGTKDVAVAPGAVTMITKNNKPYLVMNSTKDDLRAAPGFKFDRTSRAWLPQEQRNPQPKR